MSLTHTRASCNHPTSWLKLTQEVHVLQFLGRPVGAGKTGWMFRFPGDQGSGDAGQVFLDRSRNALVSGPKNWRMCWGEESLGLKKNKWKTVTGV